MRWTDSSLVFVCAAYDQRFVSVPFINVILSLQTQSSNIHQFDNIFQDNLIHTYFFVVVYSVQLQL